MPSVSVWHVAVGERLEANLRLDAATIAGGAPEIIAGVVVGSKGESPHYIGEAPFDGSKAAERTVAKAELSVQPVRFVEARFLVQLPLPADSTVSVRGTLTMGANKTTLDDKLVLPNGGGSGGYLALTWWIKP